MEINLNELKKYDYIGIRGINTNEINAYEVGQTLEPSYLWNHELDMSSYHTEEPIEIGTCAVAAVDFNDWSTFTGGWEDSEDFRQELIEKINERIEYAKSYHHYERYYLIASSERDANYEADDVFEINLVDPIVIAEI